MEEGEVIGGQLRRGVGERGGAMMEVNEQDSRLLNKPGLTTFSTWA